MIFAARQLQEKCREQHRDLYTVFVDLIKAFDMVSRSGLWLLLRKFGCTEKFTKILKSLHEGKLSRVNIGGEFSELFPVTNGVRQGTSQAPYYSIYSTQPCSVKQQGTSPVAFIFVFAL